MVASIAQLIAATNPDLYAENKDEVKILLKKEGFAKAADKAKPLAVRYTTLGDGSIKITNSGEEAVHTLVYDSTSETLEPVYFWILDLMNDFGLKVEKYVDNFSASTGSGYFSEMSQRATIMQQQGSKILGDVNTVLRSVLNIIYDLKDFRIRLQHYDSLNSKNEAEREGAILAMKQIWMDKVDIQKGQGSIHALTTGNLQFTTLRDALLAVKDEEDAKKIDLNERVRRLLLARIQEFNVWLKESEAELRKRYELEKTYLKAQVNSLKLYSRWARPYLKAASELEQKEQGRNPNLVKTFNTQILELTLLGKRAVNVKEAAIEGTLPREFERLKTKKDYYSCVLVDFTFRGIPQRISQQAHYVFGGKVDVAFKGYALNEEELKKLDFELNKSDLAEVLKLVEGATTESLNQLQEEINFFLDEKTEEKKQKEEKEKKNINPFLALFGKYDKSEESKPKEEKKEDIKDVKLNPDTWIEKEHIRPLAAAGGADMAFKLFDVYKKAHKMPSYT